MEESGAVSSASGYASDDDEDRRKPLLAEAGKKIEVISEMYNVLDVHVRFLARFKPTLNFCGAMSYFTMELD